MTDDSLFPPDLVDAVLAATNAVGQVPEEYREHAFPVLLRFALERTMAPAVQQAGRVASETPQRELLSRSPNEILAQARKQSKTSQTLLLAGHLDQSDQTTSVITIRETFQAARTPPPRNIPDVLGRLLKDGLLIESNSDDSGPKQYRLSISGSERLDSLLDSISNSP